MRAKLRKTISFILGTVFIISSQPGAFAFSTELQKKLDSTVMLYVGQSKAFVNSKERTIDESNLSVYPMVIKDKTLVPVRFISESFGAKVSTKGNDIIVSLDDKKVELEIGSKKIVVNGNESSMTVESQIIKDRTFIPLRSLSEALGKKVFWDDRGLIVISNDDDILDPDKDSYLIDSVISRFVHMGNSYGNIVNNGQVAQSGEWIYYCDENEKFMKIKIDGSQKTQISDYSVSYINIVGEWIYCNLSSNNGGKSTNIGLYKIRTDGSENIKLSDDSAQYINIIEDTIYYVNKSDYYKPYKINTDGNNRMRLNDYPAKCLNVVGNRAYFQNDIDGKLYSMNIDGTVVQKIVDDSSYNLGLNAVDGWLYYEKEGDLYGLYKVKMDGTERQRLDGTQISYINVIDDWIYYGVFRDGIYRIKTDGTGKQKLNDDDQAGIFIIGDWIFYNKYDLTNYKPLGIYKMRFDGSERQPLNKSVETKIKDNSIDEKSKPSLTDEALDSNESGNSSGNLSNSGYVAQKGDWIYYRNSSDDDKLYKVKIDGTNKTLISDDKVSFINVVAGWVYYVNESDNDKPYKIKDDGTQKTKLDDNGSGNIFVLGEDVYFSRTIGPKLYADIYKMKNDGTSKVKITNGSRIINYITVIDGWIYFSDFSGGRIYKMKVDGTKETQLNDSRIGKYIILDNIIYYSNRYENGTMYKMNIKGMENEKFDFPDNVNEFNVLDGWIYYSNKSDGDKLYKMKLDRTSKIKLSDIPAGNINIAGDWIYFRDKSDKVFNYYRVKKDGSEQEIVN